MRLTFGTGIFWLLLASTVGTTLVQLVSAMRRRGPASAPPPSAELERRVKELESQLAAQAQLNEAQGAIIARLEEESDFTQRLLRGRRESASG